MSGDTVVAAAAPGWGALRRGALLVDQAIGFVWRSSEHCWSPLK